MEAESEVRVSADGKNMDQPDSALLHRLREGDTLAFEQIYDRYKGRLAANFIRLLRNDELAKDALQDLFVRLWNSRSTIDVSQPFTSYL
ncbi:MAG TPA: sigma factor, partial [Sphingobacterium sp.]|nr:sigma factor [Sphingobacterium sp.]